MSRSSAASRVRGDRVKCGRLIVRNRSKDGLGVHGLIHLRRSGRFCWDGWRRSRIWMPKRCSSGCRPLATACSQTVSCVPCSAGYGYGEHVWFSSWFTVPPQHCDTKDDPRKTRMDGLRGGLSLQFAWFATLTCASLRLKPPPDSLVMLLLFSVTFLFEATRPGVLIVARQAPRSLISSITFSTSWCSPGRA